MPMGRPTDYTSELADEICQAVATSTDGLSKICARNPHFPTRDTIYAWRYKHKYFSDNYANAKRQQAELLAEEIIDISDNSSKDTIENENGKVSFNSEWAARSRLRVDTRKWIACKLLPKIYGDKPQTLDPETEKSLLEKLIDKL